MSILLVVLGFFISSLLFYFNHRFVSHGPLGKLPLLRHMKRLHLVHHKNDYNSKRNEHLLLPFWSKLLFLAVFGLICLFSIPLAVGCISYVFYYEWKHYQIHNGDKSSKCYHHHYLHHRKSARHNFSGTMPIIDKIFGTELKNT